MTRGNTEVAPTSTTVDRRAVTVHGHIAVENHLDGLRAVREYGVLSLRLALKPAFGSDHYGQGNNGVAGEQEEERQWHPEEKGQCRPGCHPQQQGWGGADEGGDAR